MGGKPSHAMQSNRPESGGADKDNHIEAPGLLEREKQEFAKSEEAKRDATQAEAGQREERSGPIPGDVRESND
jgi:hypothetical protein